MRLQNEQYPTIIASSGSDPLARDGLDEIFLFPFQFYRPEGVPKMVVTRMLSRIDWAFPLMGYPSSRTVFGDS